MQTMQQKIDEMHGGNTDAIIAGVHSKNDYVVMNAILSGSRLRVKSKEFIDGVKKAQENEAVLLGIPIKSVAKASICFIENRSYKGSDPVVESLIKNKFNI